VLSNSLTSARNGDEIELADHMGLRSRGVSGNIGPVNRPAVPPATVMLYASRSLEMRSTAIGDGVLPARCLLNTFRVLVGIKRVAVVSEMGDDGLCAAAGSPFCFGGSGAGAGGFTEEGTWGFDGVELRSDRRRSPIGSSVTEREMFVSPSDPDRPRLRIQSTLPRTQLFEHSERATWRYKYSPLWLLGDNVRPKATFVAIGRFRWSCCSFHGPLWGDSGRDANDQLSEVDVDSARLGDEPAA
jgi:hypothetical protein